jgi:uncharacterized protein with ParB-like and HNH nuclease domain
MQNQLSTVTRLFTDTLYRIPDYQRGYAWGDRQLKDFWSDVAQLEKDKSHYIGVLTLERVPQEVHKFWTDDTWIIASRKYQPYYVVDGQQRLTTIAILMHCLVSAIPEGGKIAFQTKDAIQRRYIFESKDDGISKSYLFGYEKDNPSYEYLKTKIFDEASINHSSQEITIYTKNLRDAKKFFNEKLKDKSIVELEELFQRISQQLLFNTYEIAEEVDVFVAFETMNNRGKPLSRLELLKNRLIYLSTRMKTDKNTLATLRKAVNEAWKDVYHYLGRNENRPLDDDNFLNRHLYIYYAKNILKIQNEEDIENRSFVIRQFRSVERNGEDFLLDKLFNPKRLQPNSDDDLPKLDAKLVSHYAADMKAQARYYFNASSPEFSDVNDDEKIWLERINRLQGFEPSSIVLFVVSTEKNVERRIHFWEVYERFTFVRSLIMDSPSFHSTRIENESEMIQLINGKKKLDEYSEYLKNTIVLWIGKDFGEILSEWAKSGTTYYGWRRIKYFLFEYEMELQMSSKTNREKLSWNSFAREKYETEYETVEHIYPQRARAEYWKRVFDSFTSKEKSQLRNSLGNLLALSRPKNASLSNKPFPEKLGDETSKIGYRYGCFSENEVALATSWDSKAIQNRGIKMLDFLEQRWKLQIGDKNAKVRALGLEFLSNKLR